MSPSPGSTSRSRMSARARVAQLLDVAERLFADHGFDGTSIEDIARGAGVTRPVVYERLGTKQSAYLAVVARIRDQLEEQMVTAALAHEGPRDQLRAGMEAFFGYVEEQPRRWTILYGSSTPMVGELGERLTDARFGTVARIADLLRVHVAEPHRVEPFSHLLSGAVEQLGRWWLRHPAVPRRDVVDHVVEFAWHGLAAHVPAPDGGQPVGGGA